MLDAKAILQIDATIIAGIFIFLTIGSIGERPTTAQVVNEFIKISEDITIKIEVKEKELLQLSIMLEEFTQEKNTIRSQIDEINKKPQEIQVQIQKITEEKAKLQQNMTLAEPTEQNKILKRLDDLQIFEQQYVRELTVAQQKIGLNELQDSLIELEQKESGLESKINQTKENIELFKEAQTKEREKFKVDLTESTSSFLKKPEDWVYQVGIPFAGSAVFALVSDFLGRYEKTKPSVKAAILGSLILMGIGFVTLIAIFFIIGGGPSLFGWK